MSDEKILDSESSISFEENSLTGSLLYKAIVEFKEKYAWDKSLISSDDAPVLAVAASDYVHEADYLEQFARTQAAQAQVQSDCKGF